jgi:transcriptional regulator with XRE-family HTH domain
MVSPMRISPQRHTLAVLRNISGLTQKEMASILECSTPTVQAVELGKLNLSDKLAGLVSHKTGINLAWLLSNDVNQPPVDVDGAPYTKELFEDYQALGLQQKHPDLGALQALHSLTMNVRRLCAIYYRAYKKDDSALCAYKLAKAFDDLEKHFGVTEEDRVAVKIPESDKIAADIKKIPKLASGYLLEGFLTSMRLESEKKLKKNKFPFTMNSEYVGTKDGQLHYTPEREPQKKPAAPASKRKKK